MDYRLEPQDLQTIYQWMENGKAEGDLQESTLRFFRLSDALRTSLLKDRSRLRDQLNRSNRQLEKIKSSKEPEQPILPFTECCYDEEELLRIIMLSARRQKIRITNTRGIHILFLIYASRLAKAGMRLTINHPVANVRGPQFWKASKALEGTFNEKAAQEARENVGQKDPGLIVHIDKAVKKYGEYPCTENNDPIAKILKESKPYKDACPKKTNNYKWNTELDDIEIWRWRKTAIGL